MISVIVVIFDPLPDSLCKPRWGIVIIQQDQIFHGPVIVFDFPLRHGMIGFCPDMLDVIFFKI